MTPPSFAEWIAALLRQLNLPSLTKDARKVATFHFKDKPDIYVTGKGHHVDMMAEAARLSGALTVGILQELLALNRCNGKDDAVGVTIDQASGTVIVWTRQRLAALSAADGVYLMECIQRKAGKVRQLVEKPGKRQHVGHTTHAALSRMLRFS